MIHNTEGARLPSANPLNKFNLLGRSEHLEKIATERTPLLGSVCLQGEATAFYGKPNSGKTLIVLKLLMDAVSEKRIEAKSVYYINVDDSSEGLATKVRILEEFGVNVLAQGHQGFKPVLLAPAMDAMIEAGLARGTFLIFDTLKKFADLMDKRACSVFAEVIRRFVLVGGTVLGLAHVNKRVGADGRPIPTGTSDILDDFDVGYVLHGVGTDPDSGEQIVEFSCIKSRGNVADLAFYTFDRSSDLSYEQRLSSVREKSVDEIRSSGDYIEPQSFENDIISSIESSIKFGTNTKMKIVQLASKAAQASQRRVIGVLEKLTGPDPAVHRWDYVRGAHGKMMYALLPRSSDG